MLKLFVKYVMFISIFQAMAAEEKDVYVNEFFNSLHYTIDKNTEVSFSFKEGAKYIPFIKEYEGQIYQVDDAFYYHWQNKKVQIGIVSKMGPEICNCSFSEVCDIAFGKKVNNDLGHNDNKEIIYNVVLTIKDPYFHDNYDKSLDHLFNLEPYIFASPNQDGSGSCLFMAVTGAAEILLNKRTPLNEIKYEGNTDLSERFLMNAPSPHRVIRNWITDTIYKYKYMGGGLLNKDYRFTKGWYKKVRGQVTKSDNNDPMAHYGTNYNWIDELTREEALMDKLISLPKMGRSLIYVDPQSNQWNVGILSTNVINKIKQHLQEKKAPVVLIYNHYSYWHATLLVGYDDRKGIGCPGVKRWIEYIGEKAEKLLSSNNPSDLQRGERYQLQVQKVKDSMKRNNGCERKGIFYVRDSIYTGISEKNYDYDKSIEGEEAPYSKRIVEKSYNWALYLGNHAFTVHLK